VQVWSSTGVVVVNGGWKCDLQGAWWRVELRWDDDRSCLRHSTASARSRHQRSPVRSRCSCQLLYCTYQAGTTHPHQHHHPNTLLSTIKLRHPREYTNNTRNWTFTQTHSLNGDGERSYHYKHLHPSLLTFMSGPKSVWPRRRRRPTRCARRQQQEGRQEGQAEVRAAATANHPYRPQEEKASRRFCRRETTHSLSNRKM